jgi:poly(glycerol-phosphate) alpha-glucosyltransferase
MSRGCPVVSYDVKYGPREQITDGVDGFLVPAGDRDALARGVIELLRSPELVERMSAAARERASRFGPQEFVAAWAAVLRSAVEQRRKRTQITGVKLDLARSPRVRWGRLQLAGTLQVELKRPRTIKAAEVELSAIDTETGDVSQLPLKVQRQDGELRIRTPGVLGPRLPDGTRLRLRCTWRNSAWETELPVSGP